MAVIDVNCGENIKRQLLTYSLVSNKPLEGSETIRVMTRKKNKQIKGSINQIHKNVVGILVFYYVSYLLYETKHLPLKAHSRTHTETILLLIVIT